MHVIRWPVDMFILKERPVTKIFLHFCKFAIFQNQKSTFLKNSHFLLKSCYFLKIGIFFWKKSKNQVYFYPQKTIIFQKSENPNTFILSTGFSKKFADINPCNKVIFYNVQHCTPGKYYISQKLTFKYQSISSG